MHLVTLIVIFISSIFSPLTAYFNNAKLVFSNFSKKVSLIVPYVWPTKCVGLKLRIFGCIATLIAGRVINVAQPLYSKWIVDSLGHPETFQYSLIVTYAVMNFIGVHVLDKIKEFLWTPIEEHTARELKVDMFSHVHSLSLRWHLSRQTGSVINIMDRGISSLDNILSYMLFEVTKSLADVGLAIYIFFTMFNNSYFGILISITATLYLTITIIMTEYTERCEKVELDEGDDYSAMMTDSLLNYETVKYYGNERYETQRLREAIEKCQLATRRSFKMYTMVEFVRSLIVDISETIGYAIAAYLIITDESLTIGDYFLFTTYLDQLYFPIYFFGSNYRWMQRLFVKLEKMIELMNEEADVKDSPEAVEYEPKGNCISVKNLTFSYNSEVDILKGISFEVGQGQSIGIVGPTGSGKSTIIRLLFRLFESNENSITYDGNDIRSLTIKSLRKQIGIVPQDTVLFNATIMYNIRFGNTEASDEEVYEAAKAAMIHEAILAMPQGYDTIVGERGLKLSGGEKQRVAIARTILKRPRFIFLDEATSALDTKTERHIQKSLDDLCSDRTGVIVAHRLSTVVRCDQILVMEKGVIIERGSHTELLTKKGTYYEMWNSQMDQIDYGAEKATERENNNPINCIKDL